MKDQRAPVLTSGDAHNEAMSLPMERVVESLVELLGAPTVAALGGVQETRAVQQWIAGTRQPQRPNVLRFALQMALMISTVASRELARAWFHGSNPQLHDLTPLTVLRDQPLEPAQVSLMIAARSFASRNGA
ncbi:MAG: hypothetical protein WCD38_11410 [Candidatus Tumulicola sp.]